MVAALLFVLPIASTAIERARDGAIGIVATAARVVRVLGSRGSLVARRISTDRAATVHGENDLPDR
jgi:hypothetical protein